MIRSTTNGTLNNYRYHLQRSTNTLNKARDTVMTQKAFNSFADDPATAARAFQLRRSYLRTNSQHTVGESVVRKYDVAWSTLESVVDEVNNQKSDSAYVSLLRAENDCTGAARNALGQDLTKKAESIVLTMNGRYGDNYVFSGADGLNIPFTWEEVDGVQKLFYRGIAVDTEVPEVELNAAGDAPKTVDQDGNDAADGKYYQIVGGDVILIDDYKKLEQDLATLDYLSKDETKYEDLGLGLEKEDGKILSSSAANTALQGINYLGYGVDDDGDPKNIVSIMSRMGEILLNCDPDSGDFAVGEREEFYRLAQKFEDSAATLSDKHVELDSEASFLQTNQALLEKNAATLNEQVVALEDVDLADAITSLSWAQYCYNAALQSGKSILSQSLMDYLYS